MMHWTGPEFKFVTNERNYKEIEKNVSYFIHFEQNANLLNYYFWKLEFISSARFETPIFISLLTYSENNWYLNNNAEWKIIKLLTVY